MELKNKFKTLTDYVNAENWDGVSDIFEDLLENHGQQLTYDHLTAGAKWMLQAEREDLCLRLCQRALVTEPTRVDAPEVMFFLFLSRHDTKQANDALILLRNADTTDKQKYVAWEILLHNETGDYGSILALYDDGKIVFDENDPRLSEIVFSVTIAFIGVNRLTEARELVDRYYPVPTDKNPNVINLHAKMCQAEGRVDEAIGYFEKVESYFVGQQVAIEARWNKSLLQLSDGRLRDGWNSYEARWEWDRFTSKKYEFPAPRWSGEDLDGKSLLIWGEQGIGDEILFLTLLPEVMKRGPSRIGILASDKICPVLARWYPDAEIFAIGDIRDKMEQELGSRFDLHLPAGSLPLVLDRMDASGTKHYLSDSEISNQLKQELLDQFPGKERVIGLSWRSGVLTHKRVQYYLSHKAIIDLIRSAPPEILFVSLQYGIDDDETRDLGQEPNVLIPDEDFLDDLLAQVRYIKACDLVVSSGSVCLALAGISATPCVTWGPSTAWTLLGTGKYPWFPLVHTIRCEPNWDLGGLVQQIQKLIEIFCTRSIKP